MKILFVLDYFHTGTHSVVRAVARELVARSHEVDIIEWGSADAAGTASYGDYDVAHAWNLRAISFLKKLNLPYGLTVHGLIAGAESVYTDVIQKFNPAWLHVMDEYTQQYLGQRGFATRITGQIIDPIGFLPLPPPETFAIGCFGGSPEIRRFKDVLEMGERLGCPAVIQPDHWLDKPDLLAEIARYSVSINLAWGASGPVAAQEALLCGRPIVSTPTTTMKEIIEPGVNGLFCDGTIEDAVRCVERIRLDYDIYYRDTCESAATCLNSPEDVADEFERQLGRLAE